MQSATESLYRSDVPTSREDQHKPRVLMVEDDPALAVMLRYNLEKLGYVVDGGRPWPGGAAARRGVRTRHRAARLDAAEPVRPRGLPADPPPAADTRPAGDHADRAHGGAGLDPRPEHRRRRLHHQAVLHGGAHRAHAGSAASRAAAAGRPAPCSSTTSSWIPASTGCSATGGRCISGRPSIACWNSCCATPRRVFSREDLLDAVWGADIHVEARTVDVHIRRLRKALNAPGEADPVRTVRSAGYALDVEQT